MSPHARKFNSLPPAGAYAFLETALREVSWHSI